MSSKGFKKGKGAKAPPKASDKEAKAAAASASANDEDEIEIENTVVDEESGQANGDGDDNVENGSEAVSNDASTEVSASTASAKGSKASSSKGKSKAPPKKNGKAPPASASSSSKASASASSSSAKPKKKSSKPSPEDWPEISVQCGTNERDIAPNARDIVVDNLSVTFHGVELIKDASLNLAWGQRYGLVGLNGTGKTTLLRALVSRKIPLPKNISVFSVQHPIEATDMSALEAVLEVDEERIELEEAATRITDKLAEAGLSDSQQADLTDALNNIYERLDEMNADTAKLRAAKLLEGLGFDPEMQQKKTRDFSGGWRMRISLARALFINPDFLVLDDASAHLDLGAVVWLEEHLKKFEKILILVSHSQDFMNGVCTNILLLRQKKLINFGGNYDTYVRTREELETNQMKQYNWEQDQIAHMKDYIARFGHGSAKLAKQAQSKEKTLEKMIRGGLTEAVTKDRVASIRFFPCGKLPPPVLQMIGITFGYPGQKKLFVNQDFGADMDSRIALVGPNGAGKSTLLKLLKGDLLPDDGMVRRHSNLRFAHFAQHTVDQLPMEETPLSYMLKEFPKDAEGNVYTLEKMRSVVGRFGITGVAQTMKIGQLSDGQKSRVVFAALAERRPNFLLLDEPSNSLDIETIDALAEAIEKWDGGVVTVSHDFRLLDRIATEIHICDHGMRKFDGDIMAYKKSLKKQMGL